MKTVILCRTNVWAGTELHALGLARTLVARGHSVVIGALDHTTQELYRARAGASLPVMSIPIRVSPRLGRRVRWSSVFQALLAFRTVRADACVLAKGTLHIETLGLDLAARFRFPLFLTIEQLSPPVLPPRSSRRYLWGTVPGMGLWWYRLWLSGYTRSLAPHVVVCVSDGVRNLLRTVYGFSDRKMIVVRNGIDASRFRSDSRSRQITRQAWGVPEDAFVFGSVGRLADIKGLDLAIDAFAQLLNRTQRDDLWLVLVGDGPKRAELEKAVAHYDLSSRVIFTGLTDRAWEAYPALDVFLMPSRQEGLPHALLEAMAAGCFPIAAGVDGIPEVIVRPDLGRLVPPEDRAALLAAMEASLAMTCAERNDVGRRAREHVVANFDATSQYLKIAALLEGESA